jgi:twitching motility protein PilT
MELQTVLQRAIDAGASDVHLLVSKPPIIRVSTQLMMMRDMGDVAEDDLGRMVLDMVGEEKFRQFVQSKDLDFSTTLKNGARFRVNAHFQKGTTALAFRAITPTVPALENLGLPAILGHLCDLPRGLILVAGPTGSGKSTTLAAMIDKINAEYCKHIITVEDPIEYDMVSNASIIEQREIGGDCESFASGLRHVLRQDPDVILVGEMRDLETTSAAVTAAETGHLVFSTLHTVSAAQTVERIIDIYPADQQNQIRTMLANTLQAVICQTLFKRNDGKGMIPCVEIMLCTTAVRNCIRENRVFEIRNIIETSRKLGMQSLDNAIADVYLQGLIEYDDAITRAADPEALVKAINARETARQEREQVEQGQKV